MTAAAPDFDEAAVEARMRERNIVERVAGCRWCFGATAASGKQEWCSAHRDAMASEADLAAALAVIREMRKEEIV